MIIDEKKYPQDDTSLFNPESLFSYISSAMDKKEIPDIAEAAKMLIEGGKSSASVLINDDVRFKALTLIYDLMRYGFFGMRRLNLGVKTLDEIIELSRDNSLRLINRGSGDTCHISITEGFLNVGIVNLQKTNGVFEASVSSGRIPTKTTSDKVLDYVTELANKDGGTPVVFSDSSASRTFSKLFANSLDRFILSKEYRNPRTGANIRFGLLKNENMSNAEVKTSNNTYRVYNDFNGLCGGASHIESRDLTDEKIVSAIKSNGSALLTRKGIVLLKACKEFDTELMKKHNIHNLDKNLFYYGF